MKTVVRAGLANFLSNFTSIPTLDEDDDEPIVIGDCDEVERYLRLPQIALHNASGHDQDILYIGGSNMLPTFLFCQKWQGSFWLLLLLRRARNGCSLVLGRCMTISTRAPMS